MTGNVNVYRGIDKEQKLTPGGHAGKCRTMEQQQESEVTPAPLSSRQTPSGVRRPVLREGDPPAADQSEGFHRRGHPVELRGSAQAAGRPEERPADGAGGHVRTQAEGDCGAERSESFTFVESD